jgi:hypothetical protein
LTLAEFGKSRNYFDLLRALAGSLAIVGSHFIEGALVAGAEDRLAHRQVLGVSLAIVVVGLLIQVIRYERRHISFYAPVFYIAGLTVALCGHWAALFAFALVWGINTMFGNAEAFLTVYGILLVGFGILFHDTPRIMVIAALAICLLPVVLALLTRRPLVVFSRKAVHGERVAQ